MLRYGKTDGYSSGGGGGLMARRNKSRSNSTCSGEDNDDGFDDIFEDIEVDEGECPIMVKSYLCILILVQKFRQCYINFIIKIVV